MATAELFNYNKFYNTIDHYPINNFTIYGERHSGTSWLQKVISNTFSIPVTWNYGHKHFFGCCEWEVLGKAHNTLFIGIVRNIYNWTRGMTKIPYHLNNHNIFAINPWISYMNGKEVYCDSHWYDHKKYTDIFAMRHHKIEFLYLYMPYLVDNYIFIRYEDLIKHYTLIINYISHIYNMPINYQYKNLIDNSKLYLNETKQSKIDLINDHAVWKTENLIGYTKINSIKDKNYMIGNAY